MRDVVLGSRNSDSIESDVFRMYRTQLSTRRRTDIDYACNPFNAPGISPVMYYNDTTYLIVNALMIFVTFKAHYGITYV